MSNLLQKIQKLQFSERSEAEALLLDFIRQTFPGLEVESVKLRPQAVSLNSFNGFITLENDQQLFFKTHTEEDNVIDEYYNATMLSDAGYPIIKPLHSSTRAGQHLLIYEVIDDPSVFDVAWSIEQGEDVYDFTSLKNAQVEEDKLLYQRYVDTLRTQDATESSPIHQLFYHRLVGGRMDRFYSDETIVRLPNMSLPMSQLKQMKWRINDQIYDVTLKQIIADSIARLEPTHNDASIIGHGDAHNGNVFYRGADLLYFDPAFAGRHPPLLDLTKPLFHNAFAMWMYFPFIKRDQTQVKLHVANDVIKVEYDYDLPDIRHMFLNSKIEHTLIPILLELKRQRQLRDDWRAYLKSALFCCPFLTLNLTDTTRFPHEITLLGFSMAMEMGAESHGQRSLIDTKLDYVQQSIN